VHLYVIVHFVYSEFPTDVDGACALPPQQCSQDSDDKERVSGILSAFRIRIRIGAACDLCFDLNTQSKYGSGSRNSKKYENKGYRNCVTQIKKKE
jgi:hypothetical protein